MSDNRKAGTITLAIGLIIFGCILLTTNFMGISVLLASLKLWPIILIGLGVEYFIRRYLNNKTNPDVETKFHMPTLIILLLIAFSVFSIQQIMSTIKIPDVNSLISEAAAGTKAAYSRTYTKDIAVRAGASRLVLDDISSKVDIVPSSDQKLHVKAYINAWASTQNEAKKRAEMVKINVDEGEIINLAVVETNELNVKRSPEISVRVMVPKGMNISIKNQNGDLKADSIEGNLVLSGGICRMDLSGIKGTVICENQNGDSYFNNINGNLQIFSQSGNAYIKDAAKDVYVKCDNGNIQFSNSQPVKTNYNLNSESGDISLQIPVTSNAVINAKTEKGNINGSLPNMNIEEKSGPGQKVKTTIGTGIGTINLNNSNGNIKIDRL